MGLLDPQIVRLLQGEDPAYTEASPGAGLLGGGTSAPTQALPNGPGQWLGSPMGQAVLSGAFGYLANAHRGAPLNNLGRAGLAAVNGYTTANERLDRQAQEAQLRQLRSLQIGTNALQLQNLATAAKRDQAIKRDLTRLSQEDQSQANRAAVAPMLDREPADEFGTAGVAGLPLYSMKGPEMFGAHPAAVYTPPQPQGGMRGAVPQAIASLTVGNQPSAAPAQIGASRGNYSQGLSNRFVKQAEVYAANGDLTTANKLYEQAAKWMPEVHKIEVAMHQGQPVNVITMKDGQQVLSPFSPTPKVHWADNGGSIIPVNEYTMQPLGGIKKTMTPGEVASTQVAQGNLAMRQREFANTVSQQGKATFHDGQWVYPPSQQNPTGVAVAPAGMAPKALTEFQGKSTSYAARMQDASRSLAELERAEGGPPSPNQVAQAGYRAEFPNWLPGGQVLGGMATAANNTFNPMVTDAAQKYRQAQENWVAAALRQESGAAIGKEEMDKYIRTFFPQPGDSDAVKQQKAAARKVSERAMLTQAGPGAQQIPSILGGADSGSSAGSPDWKYLNGKLVKVK